MTTPTIWHDGALEWLSPLGWPSLTFKAMLWHETSTAAPAESDIYVADLVPASNELVNDDYDRVTVTGKTSTLVAGAYELAANTVSFGVLSGATLTQGCSGWSVYAHIGADSANILIASRTFDPVTFNGTEVTIPFPDGIFARQRRATP